jgi:hypothetical protein
LPADEFGIIDMTNFTLRNQTQPSLSDIHSALPPPAPTRDTVV